MVQWLGLCASSAGGLGSIPGQGTRILQATWHGQKKNSHVEDNFLFSVSISPQRNISNINIHSGYFRATSRFESLPVMGLRGVCQPFKILKINLKPLTRS